MSEILLSNQVLNPTVLESLHGINADELTDISCRKPTIVAPNTPYLINHNGFSAVSHLASLSPLPVARNLTNLSLSYGGYNVVPIADSKIKRLQCWLTRHINQCLCKQDGWFCWGG